ncbi:Uncharacterized protein GBIM_18648 [Gryllus bimaculatus]|nr:Uncharacterized protein GBIM_18648 [Gryllus bimaculatus]
MVRRDCFLSSDDTFAADRTALLIDRDFFYSERGTCSNVRVDCTQSDMLITFIFGAPFEGRVYATGNPQACFEMGSGQNQLVLRIPMGTQCGTVQQGRGRYVNHVVIQQNPVIMQETDKTVRVECSFDASDQTVSYAPSGTRNQDGGGISVTVPFRPSGTNIVTNTAPTPNVRMRIVTRKGQEAAVVGLGEELLLKIEIDPTSAFGIFVRNLEARTDNGELLTLIDNVGCPRDPNIFPALQVEGGTRNLLGPFKAFRFPSTPTVNFVATVQFCQDICEPIRCSTGVHSFGRKRRQVSSIIEDTENLKLNENRTVSLADVESEDISLSRLQTANITSSTTIENTETTTDSSSSKNSEYFTNGPEPPVQSSDPPLRNPEPAPKNPQPALRNPEPPVQNPEPPLRKQETTTKNIESSLLENSNETNSASKLQDPELPNELPLQLRLVVGEDSIPKPSPENKKRNDRKYGPITIDNVRSETSDLNSNDKTVFYAKSDYVCTPTSTVIASVLTLLLFNIGFIIIFALFYRVRKKQWEKLASVDTKFNQVPVPEVLFRSVYGRLPPNPTLTTLSHQLSS